MPCLVFVLFWYVSFFLFFVRLFYLYSFVFSVFRYVVICVAIVLFVCLFDGRLLYLENNVGKFLKKLVLRRWGSVTRSFGFIYLCCCWKIATNTVIIDVFLMMT